MHPSTIQLIAQGQAGWVYGYRRMKVAFMGRSHVLARPIAFRHGSGSVQIVRHGDDGKQQEGKYEGRQKTPPCVRSTGGTT